MALTKCHECSAAISDTAKACPHCGAKPKQKISLLGWIVAAIFTMGVIQCTSSDIARKEQQASKSPDQIAAEQKAKDAAEKRHQIAVIAMHGIKKALRDPDSVQWEDVLVDDDASTVCITYRARNGYGGFVRENATFAGGKAYKTDKAWNTYCAGKQLIDHKYSARALP